MWLAADDAGEERERVESVIGIEISFEDLVRLGEIKNTPGALASMGATAPVDLSIQMPECIKDLTNRIVKQANLATGYANVQTKDGLQSRRILLDTGSQRSYITNRLAKFLKAPVVGKERLINHTFGGRAAEVREYSGYRVNLVSRFAPQAFG